MKKLFSIFVLALMLPLAACAKDYQEGKHYTVVGETLTAKPEVREFFSFYCPHCLSFEPFMKDLAKSLPEGATFEKNHVDFMRAASPQVQFEITKSMIVAQQLPQEETLIAAIFDAIQKQRKPLASQAELRELFTKQGVDGEQFDKLMKSFGVNSKAKHMKKLQEQYTKNGALTGVPTIIVNGKYRVNASELDRGDFLNDYKNIVLYLLTLKS
ncbi:thiol:disulfide interchange protein DsbA/DsbL [Thalassotalea sp. HSM 43]|uniref:thiol:disulfide interchange protein DsbA/DsbL n=1 Tax=Thalassotalea sp. HSM 43 TaxID=2552945 RepID=UPI0010819636|nr:thiol:disulfide interchange protein DsbA/DsbL [Thalassotalea sp. HSM 43]QBY04274.1 thiol:disulfide interchange protein DsbA/DsbL [Thalassotalea sp. HSM 43]